MYQMNEGTIDLPSDWVDQSVNIVTSAAGSTPGLSFSVTRDDVPWGMDFSEYVAGEIEKAEDALSEFKILSRETLTVSDVEAVEIECTWKSAQGPMHQLITTVNGKRALVLTASQPGKMSETQKTQVRKIVASLALKPEGAA